MKEFFKGGFHHILPRSSGMDERKEEKGQKEN